MARLFLVLVSLFAACISSHAEDSIEFKLSEVPPLFQIQIFQSENNPEHFILLGKDSIYGDSGSWYVIDWSKGKVTSPKQNQDSWSWSSGGFDLDLKSGLYLHISGNQSSQGVLRETMSSALLDPNQGREPLKRIEVSEELLNRLKLTEMIAPKFIEGLRLNAANPPKALLQVPDAEVALISFRYSGENEKDFSSRWKDVLRENVVIENMSYHDGVTRWIWTFKNQVAKVIEHLRSVANSNGTAESALSIEVIFDNFNRYQNIEMSFSKLEKEVAAADSNQKAALFAKITPHINSLYWDYDLQKRPIGLLKRWQGSENAIESLNKNFQEPILSLMERGFKLLHQLETKEARKSILFVDAPATPRVGLLDTVAVDGRTYFQEWLHWIGEHISWYNRATPEERKTLQTTLGGGSTLVEFPFIMFDRYEFVSKGSGLQWDDFRSQFPLLIFGMREAPDYRKEFERFVVQMDKVAQYQLLNFIDKRLPSRDSVVGNVILIRTIQSLAFAAQEYRVELNQMGFSKARYYRQVMMIITELLDSSRTTITNNATYLAILDTAVSLQRNVQKEFGLVPNMNETGTPREMNDLTVALMNLQRAMQTRLMRALYINATDGLCASMLRPH